MKSSDFTNHAPGRVIQTPKGYQAFVPDPLPPQLTWSTQLMASLSRAERQLARLAEVGNAFPAPHTVARPFIRKEAVLSSQIEGTRTTFQELLSYEAGQLSLFNDREQAQEVQNYVKALDFGLSRLSDLPLSIRLTREIHGVLMKGVRGERMTPGEVRRSQNWIGRPGATLATASFVPPPIDDMHTCLSDLERFIHTDSDLPPLVRIAMIHYQFEVIHPFLDGNGRVGRLLISLLLQDWRLLSQPLLNLSSYLETHRQVYYDHLMSVSQKGAWEDWLRFFLEGVAIQAEDTTKRINQLEILRTRYQNVFSGDRNRKKLAQLVDYLIGTPITTITQAKENLAIGSFTTIQRQIEKLEELGIIREVTGYDRNRIYRADEIMRILEK